jgi:hypothetical protein
VEVAEAVPQIPLPRPGREDAGTAVAARKPSSSWERLTALSHADLPADCLSKSHDLPTFSRRSYSRARNVFLTSGALFILLGQRKQSESALG